MAEWTDELRAEVVEAYKAENPTPENTMDIVKQLADDFEKTPNGVGAILRKAGVYIKKAAAASSSSAASGESKTPTVSKAQAISDLKDIIASQGLEPNGEVIDKLTGKAAIYFKEVIASILPSEEE